LQDSLKNLYRRYGDETGAIFWYKCGGLVAVTGTLEVADRELSERIKHEVKVLQQPDTCTQRAG